jgi:hypothetical protein
MENFEKELESLINKHSMENASDTPDFILARYLYRCLQTFNDIIHKRENWYGREINELKERVMPQLKVCKPDRTPEELAQNFIVEATVMNFNSAIPNANRSDTTPVKITAEQLLEDSDLSYKVYKQVKEILFQRSKKIELSPNDLRFYGNDTVVLSGKKYRLVPAGMDWEITLICPTNLGPNCPCGHNGKTLPENHKILRIKTISQTSAYYATEEYNIGDKIQQGIIESFRLTGGYLQASILGTGRLVDVDNFRKV